MAYVIQVEIDAELAKKGSKEAVKSIRAVGGESKKADKQVTNMEKAVKRLDKALKAMAVALPLATLFAFVKVTKASISAFIEQERVVAQLESALVATGGAAGVTSQELQMMASSLQQVTTFGDEATMAMQGILLTFRNIGSEIFERTTVAVLDMSTAMGQDLRSSAVMLGKALNDPVLGMTALQRTGITFSESQKQMVKDLVASNRTLDAQKLILKELEMQFGGSAKAARDTLGGSIKALNNSFGDLLEMIGEVVSEGAELPKLFNSWSKSLDKVAGGAITFKLGYIKIWRDVTVFFTESIKTMIDKFLEFLRVVEKGEKVFAAFTFIDVAVVSKAVQELETLSKSMGETVVGVKKLAASAIVKTLVGAAGAAKDLGKNLGVTNNEMSEIQKKIAEQIKINAELHLKVNAATLEKSFQDSIENGLREVDVSEPMEQVLRDAIQNTTMGADGIILPNQGPANNGMAVGGAGDDVAQAASQGVVQLVDAMEGLSDTSKAMVSAFANIASAMASTKITATDWVTLIVQIGVALIGDTKKQRQQMVQDMRDISAALTDLRTSLNALEEATDAINQKYDKITKNLQKANFEADPGLKSMSALGDEVGNLGEIVEGTSTEVHLLNKVELKRQQELAAATRKVQQEGFGGLIDIFEQLQLYIDDQKIADHLAHLRLLLEINNMKIQLDTLKALGTVAQETLGWIETMIGEVERGLLDGSLTVGGPKAKAAKTGPGRRDQLVAMFEEAARMAGIMEDQVGSMLGHFHEMRVLASKIKMSEEQRSATAAEIAMREAQAADQLGLSLLDRVAQATDNEAMLVELEAARFEVERAHTIEQIDLLIASGKLTDDMAERLAKARDDFADFDFEALSKAATDWASLMDALRGFGEQASNAERLRDAFDQSMQFLVDSGLPDAQIMEKAGEAWRLAHEAAENIALTMIDTLAKAVGSEEDIAKVAKLRHFLEVASFRAQAEMLKPLLDPETFAWLTRLIDDFAMMDPNSGSRSGGGNNRVVRAIEDQTNSLLEGWKRVMSDLLTGSDSPLSPKQQKDFLQGQYNRLFALARSGDTVAEAELQNLIPQFRDAMAVFTGGTQTSAFNDFFGGLMRDISLLSGLENPLPGLGFTGGSSTASTDNIIGSFQAFEAQADQASAQAHQDSRELRQEIRNLNDKIDLLAAKQSAAGSG